MTEKDLISKIQELKSIKPRENWVLFAKNNIFKESNQLPIKEQISFISVLRGFSFQPKMALSFLALFGLFVSTFSFAQQSLPGDLLYPIKKIVEKSQSALVPDTDNAKLDNQLSLVNKRLDELTEIAKTNRVNNLAAAISEAQVSISETSQNLKKSKSNLAVVAQVKQIKAKTAEIKSLGVEIGEVEFDAVLVTKIKEQADALSAEKLTINQAGILEEVRQDIDAKKYADAWEKILVINGITN